MYFVFYGCSFFGPLCVNEKRMHTLCLEQSQQVMQQAVLAVRHVIPFGAKDGAAAAAVAAAGGTPVGSLYQSTAGGRTMTQVITTTRTLAGSPVGAEGGVGAQLIVTQQNPGGGGMITAQRAQGRLRRIVYWRCLSVTSPLIINSSHWETF